MIRVILLVSVCATQIETWGPAPRANSSPLDLDSRLAAQILGKHLLEGQAAGWTVDERLIILWWKIDESKFVRKKHNISQQIDAVWHWQYGGFWKRWYPQIIQSHLCRVLHKEWDSSARPGYSTNSGAKKGGLPAWPVPVANQTRAAMGNPILKTGVNRGVEWF